MAIVEVKVPQLSESVAEATMLTWKKKAGEAVAVDEILIEIETDKVVLEIPAPAAGVLSQVLVKGGATVTSGQPIAQIDTEAAAGAPAAGIRHLRGEQRSHLPGGAQQQEHRLRRRRHRAGALTGGENLP